MQNCNAMVKERKKLNIFKIYFKTTGPIENNLIHGPLPRLIKVFSSVDKLGPYFLCIYYYGKLRSSCHKFN